jgi:hypothetical protein
MTIARIYAHWGAILWLAICGLLLVPLRAAEAQDRAELQNGGQAEGAVESGREALRGAQRFPWYDAKADGLRRIDVRTAADSGSSNRDSNWQNQGTAPADLSLFGEVFWTIMQVLAWTLLAVLLIGIVALLIWAFVRGEGRQGGGADSAVSVRRASDIDRVESLPFQVKRPHSDLLAEARRQYEAGNYGEAIVYLFSYQLVQLDKQQIIQLTKGKTNRQYLREVRREPRLRSLLETTMVAFEDVFFGHHELDRQRFETCWSGLDEFHQQIQQATS